MKTRIIVDSTADLMPEFKSRVYAVPLIVHFGPEEYIDGVTIDHKTFYEKLIESDVLPTTSQASPYDFMNVLGKARGSKNGNNLLVQEINKAGGVDFSKPVLLGYSGISDALLKKYIEDSRHLWDGNLEQLRYTTVGSVIGTHAGPGAVVVTFFKN